MIMSVWMTYVQHRRPGQNRYRSELYYLVSWINLLATRHFKLFVSLAFLCFV